MKDSEIRCLKRLAGRSMLGGQDENPHPPHLELCDVVTMWTWNAAGLADLDENFARFEHIVGSKRKLLGVYMWDYGARQKMPLDAMERQCSLGLRWLREGRIEGIIFLASCICDLGLEAVEWARRWIGENGNVAL